MGQMFYSNHPHDPSTFWTNLTRWPIMCSERRCTQWVTVVTGTACRHTENLDILHFGAFYTLLYRLIIFRIKLTTLSFLVHVKLFFRIVSYRIR